MKETELGKAGNVGNFARWVIFGFLLAALAAPTLHYKPWTKVEHFFSKVYGDKLKKKE